MKCADMEQEGLGTDSGSASANGTLVSGTDPQRIL